MRGGTTSTSFSCAGALVLNFLHSFSLSTEIGTRIPFGVGKARVSKKCSRRVPSSFTGRIKAHVRSSTNATSSRLSAGGRDDETAGLPDKALITACSNSLNRTSDSLSRSGGPVVWSSHDEVDLEKNRSPVAVSRHSNGRRASSGNQPNEMLVADSHRAAEPLQSDEL